MRSLRTLSLRSRHKRFTSGRKRDYGTSAVKIVSLVVCSLVITADVFAQSSGSDFLKEAARDFERDSAAMEQRMQNDIVAQRLQELENQRAAEIQAQQAAEAKHAAWLRKADAALNASWYRMQRSLTRQYPDLKNAQSTMFLLFQHIAQGMRDQENPIMLDALAPQLIADSAARQLGITALPPPSN